MTFLLAGSVLGLAVASLVYASLSWIYSWKTRRLIEREAAERRAWSKFKED